MTPGEAFSHQFIENDKVACGLDLIYDLGVRAPSCSPSEGCMKRSGCHPDLGELHADAADLGELHADAAADALPFPVQRGHLPPADSS